VLSCPQQAPGPRLMTDIRSLPADTRGVTALEYALIAAIIGVVTVGVMQGVGKSLLQNFNIIVEAARETPQPMQVVDTRLPTPPVREAPRPPRAPVPDLDDDESSGAAEAEAGAETPDDIAGAPGTVPGIAPAEPALGAWDEEVPVATLITPPGRDSSQTRGLTPTGKGRGAFPPIAAAPPGYESSGDDGGERSETESAAETSAAQANIPPKPMFTDRQKAALRSAFILFLWAAFGLCLANLIWRIATRKAHEREVEDQLEDWQPASFG
jgi:Flp pilus assembly pilin Flp